MYNLQKISIRKMLLLLGALVFVAGLAQFAHPGTAMAADGPVCVRLGQGELACPDETRSDDGKTKFPAGKDVCYFYDPGNPNAGTVKGFTGWQKITCDSDLFKEGRCVGDAGKQSPYCQRIGVSKDSALDCPKTDCNLTTKYLEPLINALAGMVGVVVAASIIYGGVQYASSADDPQKVTQAKSRITTSLIALVSFFFLYMFLQWLMPGGIL